MEKVEEFYYLRSENKGADQLHSYCEADRAFVFALQNVVFLMTWLKILCN